MDDLSLTVEGHHAVSHMQEEGGELGPLVIHLLNGALKLSGHVVEGIRQNTDLIVRRHLDLMIKVTLTPPSPYHGG